MINENPGLVFASVKYNFEDKTLEELKKIRELFNLKGVRQEDVISAYFVRMIDILLEKIERLEKEIK